ncbi:hypothetical protein CW368_12545 [Actinomycetales bacterium SN12]|nr:hypothetical protein CW368_12545 [Actinomycetales bacterium SN12]
MLLVVLVLAAVGGGVWLAIAQPWAAPVQADRTPASDASALTTPSGSPSASPEASPEPSETPGIAACTPEDVTVTAVTDADTYPAEALPQLSILLANTGARDCTLNVGSSTQSFTVSSGDDVWWRSTDCQSESSDMIVTLAAGSSVPSASPVVWDRTRSSAETCEEQNRPRAPGGGASYHVAVSIGGFSSETPKQILLR